MLTKTSAIVLSVAKHNDKSSILRAYTRTGGRVNYIMYGHRFRPSPLSLVELTYDLQPTRDIQTIKTISLTSVAPECGSDTETVSRQCVSMFVAEVLQSIFMHPMEDRDMYDFLVATVRDINTCADPENSHLRFLVGLSIFLGFGEPEVVVPTGRQQRQQILRDLLAHFATHIEDFPIPRSLDVLTEIFD